ncbi:MAG: tetratricopeptide repeat protein [Acidimicrobiales bacterium]|nr:tetratricopeptide repeat protein [Acidimicrobiales bacterium]
MARRGARALVNPSDDRPGASASDLWRQAVARSDAERGRPAGGVWEADETWIAEPEPEDRHNRPPGKPARQTTLRDVATGREGTASPGGHRRKVPKPVVEELAGAAGSDRGAKLAHRIADATYAYEKERYQEARRILRGLAEEVRDSPTVRELYGLVLYRTGQWAAAAKQLESFRQLTGSFDQHPVLADCYRALRRFPDAEGIWEELREASPGGDLVAEGRIVAAGCRADQGDLSGAIALLERSARKVARPQERHLRQWYALADLYERAGDVPRARDLFRRVADTDPDAFDVRARLQALR